jgi:hypothetical protein
VETYYVVCVCACTHVRVRGRGVFIGALGWFPGRRDGKMVVTGGANTCLVLNVSSITDLTTDHLAKMHGRLATNGLGSWPSGSF